jgi:hypothetical protein
MLHPKTPSGSLTAALLAGLLLAPAIAVADPRPDSTLKTVRQFSDAKALSDHLRSRGYKSFGSVDRGSSDRDEHEGRGFPHFTSTLSSGGTTWPITMVGHPPQSGRSSHLRSVIIPLRMNFQFFGPSGDVSHSFEPAPAAQSLAGSPIYLPAQFPNGFGQFGDQLQRAAFWNQMDAGHSWHVKMEPPRALAPIDVYVTPETGTLFTDAAGNSFGDVYIDFLDAQARTILQLLDLDADVLPIFVTDNVTAEALGFHTAYPVGASGRLQTYVYTSWLDPALVDPLFADVSTFNHELAEWMNDPFTNNVVPVWAFPPASDPAAVCSGNNLLEVGDPQGNGPTFPDFPTVPVTLQGVTYHLQQVVLWQWFTGAAPSSAFGGWFTFPQPSSLTQPAVLCQ